MEIQSYKMFMCFTRKFRADERHPPFDVVEAFANYSNRGAHMSSAQFWQFLVDFQAEDPAAVTEAHASAIVDHILQRHKHFSKSEKKKKCLTIDDFFYFLFSDDLNDPLIDQVHHDMTAPLQHYFVYTGHNSYLTGNQHSSDCSDIPIIRALQRGVRVIELDVWPNSSKDDINVLHGRTLTAPVQLIKCLKSIKQYAFFASPYPVIITLEDHLTPELQAKVAKMATEVFEEMLFFPEPQHFIQFPSPEELKHRIILSTKPPKEYLERTGKEKGVSSPAESSGYDSSSVYESDSDQDNEDVGESGDMSKPTVQGPPEYKCLIAIRAGKPKDGLKETLQVESTKLRRLSLSEHLLEKAVSNYAPDVVRFTQRNFLRIYPKGTRITSSNYKPLVGWMYGAQMVAFNMQGYGKPLWLMQGMFRGNGGCGYVKKPNILMRRGPEGEVIDLSKESEVKKTLKVRVYMGDGWRMDFSKTHFDAYSPPDFYVKLYIVGVPADYAKSRTKVVENNWEPVWDEEFKFPLRVPELALLQIEVREYDISDKDDFGGQTCFPVSEIKSGIRAVPLFDKKGDKIPSVRLLMKFQFS